MQVIQGERFAATVMPTASGDPHILSARIKLRLAVGLNPATTPTPITKDAFLVEDVGGWAEGQAEDTMETTMEASNPSAPSV